jgi:hypothetical protein
MGQNNNSLRKKCSLTLFFTISVSWVSANTHAHVQYMHAGAEQYVDINVCSYVNCELRYRGPMIIKSRNEHKLYGAVLV